MVLRHLVLTRMTGRDESNWLSLVSKENLYSMGVTYECGMSWTESKGRFRRRCTVHKPTFVVTVTPVPWTTVEVVVFRRSTKVPREWSLGSLLTYTKGPQSGFTLTKETILEWNYVRIWIYVQSRRNKSKMRCSVIIAYTVYETEVKTFGFVLRLLTKIVHI